ncbi:hypothetical protein [Brevibacterium antiquum]|uniref:Uncharacterized protein n=1 Tax=Brevibacterium antiquum TaxID=234835 RepID=A0A2H1KAV4_9MICO|nr:hypothetical protein [Brevibacterium antiquum]SMX96779.1 hypothetical protein BANT10_02870 [Brevibacterium antiquum]
MMPAFMEPEFSPWFGTDWPTTTPNTTETLENVQEVSLLYLAALFAVAFIIWWILAIIARSKTGRISTKRLLVLIGMAGIAVTLALLSGEGGVSPWIDVAIVNIGFVPLFLLIVGLYIAMPFAVASAVLVVIARLMVRIWSGPKHERNTSAAGLLNKGEQS